MYYLICFDKEHEGRIRCLLFVVLPLINTAVLRIDILCRHPNIRDESNTYSGVQY